MEHAPLQLDIVQLPPLHGTEQPPAWVQSTLHVAPTPQSVWQLPACDPLQSTLQVDWAAHSVLQPPFEQATAHGDKRELQAKSQAPLEEPAA
jgi:hypothetical protein